MGGVFGRKARRQLFFNQSFPSLLKVTMKVARVNLEILISISQKNDYFTFLCDNRVAFPHESCALVMVVFNYFRLSHIRKWYCFKTPLKRSGPMKKY